MKKLFLVIALLVFTASFAMAEKMTTIKGEAAAVDAVGKTLTVKEKEKEVVLNITDQTKIKAGKEKKELADIKAGDKITARTTEKDGKTIARAIWFGGGTHEKGKMKMKEEKK